jgi:hypothetical protein
VQHGPLCPHYPWKYLLFVLFVLHLSVIVLLEVIFKQGMVIALKRNKLTISEEVKIIQEVEENPSMS